MNRKASIGVRVFFASIALLCIVFGILGIRDHLWHLLVIGGMLFFVSIFWPFFKRSYVGKIVRIIIVGILLAYAVLDLVLITAGIAVANKGISPDKEMTVVILGTDTKGDQPGSLLKFRLDRAIEYLRQSPDTKVIVTGKGRGEYSEADVMKKYLMEQGVGPARIYLEDRAQSTRENFIFSQGIAKKENLPERFLVVTNNYHQLRASIYAKGYGIVSETLSAPTTWYMLFPLSERERYLIVTEWMGLSPDLIQKYQEI